MRKKTSLTSNIQTSIDGHDVAKKLKLTVIPMPQHFKTDIQSITKGYRIYLLILPLEARIAAASDRIVTITSLMTDLSAKLPARITSRLRHSGTDMLLPLNALT